jgi:hypothetical protein
VPGESYLLVGLLTMICRFCSFLFGQNLSSFLKYWRIIQFKGKLTGKARQRLEASPLPPIHEPDQEWFQLIKTTNATCELSLVGSNDICASSEELDEEIPFAGGDGPHVRAAKSS